MKNVFDEGAAAQLAQRAQKLQAGTAPLWGTMSAAEMLAHCNRVNAHLLVPAAPPTKKTSVKQLLARWVVLYGMPRLPKGAQAPRQVLTKGTVGNEAFNEQQQLFVDMVHRMGQHTLPVHHRHPYFGNLNTKQWGLAAWKHIDHHLRQFGV